MTLMQSLGLLLTLPFITFGISLLLYNRDDRKGDKLKFSTYIVNIGFLILLIDLAMIGIGML